MLMPKTMRRPVTAIVVALLATGLIATAGSAPAKINVGEGDLTRSQLAEIEAQDFDQVGGEAKRPVMVRKARPPVHVQCWQEGIKIIDESGLSEIALANILPRTPRTSVLDGDALGLKGRDGAGARIMVVPLRDATCLVRDAS